MSLFCAFVGGVFEQQHLKQGDLLITPHTSVLFYMHLGLKNVILNARNFYHKTDRT